MTGSPRRVVAPWQRRKNPPDDDDDDDDDYDERDSVAETTGRLRVIDPALDWKETKNRFDVDINSKLYVTAAVKFQVK